MSYDEREQELKRKKAKDYWGVAFYVYCIEQQKKRDQAGLDALNSLTQFILDPKDKDKDRIETAQKIILTAEQTHKDIKLIDDLREEARRKLEEMSQKDPKSYPDTIRDNIINACSAFVQEKDQTKLAIYATCVLEHLDAMNADPKLAAEVNLSTKQMTAAAQVITVGLIIQEGLKALEMEFNDAVSDEPTITAEQHLMNITKITAMQSVEKKRINGNMLKELQECDMMKELTKEDRFEFAAKLTSKEYRRTMTEKLEKSVEKELPAPTPKAPTVKAPTLGLSKK